jgi:hypothetical protein
VAEPVYRTDLEALESVLGSLELERRRSRNDRDCAVLTERIHAVERAICRLEADRDKEQP